MAKQFYHPWFDYYRVDVHGCSFKTAMEVVLRRLDDCYAYGIPFLEIVHGSSDKAAQQSRRSIGFELLHHLEHPAVKRKLPLSQYGYQHLWDGRSTALRFCILSNPAVQQRSTETCFKGFWPEYEVRSSRLSSEIPVWELETYDAYPFKAVSAALYDVETGLCGDPLSPKFSWNYEADLDTLLVAEAVEKVTNLKANPASRFERTLNLTAAEFSIIRFELLRGSLTGEQIASLIGCPLEWLTWCSSFAFANIACHCAKAFRAHEVGPRQKALSINFLTTDGDCKRQWCYLPGTEDLVGDLWRSHGLGWKPPAPNYSDSSPYQAAKGFCNGKHCKCASTSLCKEGEAKTKRLWSLWT
jgi:hypothetical protein